jgi:hypothetical protein
LRVFFRFVISCLLPRKIARGFEEHISRADVDTLVRSVKDGKTAKIRPADQIGGSEVTGGAIVANRCLALMSKMLNLAERWGWRSEGSNPCRHVDRYREGAVRRMRTGLCVA